MEKYTGLHLTGGEQKAVLALSHRGTPEVPHPPTKKKKKVCIKTVFSKVNWFAS